MEKRTGDPMTEAVEKLKAYRTRLLKAGKLVEARAVARCIKLVTQTAPDRE